MRTKQGHVGPVGFSLHRSMVICHLRISCQFVGEMRPLAFLVESSFESFVGSQGCIAPFVIILEPSSVSVKLTALWVSSAFLVICLQV